jgi:hypothetical protein
MLYEVASKPQPLETVLQNLIPRSLVERRKYLDDALHTNRLRYFHSQQFLPRTDIELKINLEASLEGKWIILHFMEFNGSWQKPPVQVLIKPGAKPDDFYITDLGDHQAAFDAIGLGKADVGDPAFIMTDLHNQAVLPHVDAVEAGRDYVLHAAVKNVRFVYVDPEGCVRELLQAVIYGALWRPWCDRVRSGLGISEWAAMTFMRGDDPIPPEYKYFRFSTDANNLDCVSVRTDAFSPMRMLFEEYPVNRVSQWAIVRFPAPSFLRDHALSSTDPWRQHMYSETQLIEHYWFTHCADIAVPSRIRPGVRLLESGLAADAGLSDAPPLHKDEKRARDKKFLEYAPDLRRELVRLARFTPGCHEFATRALVTSVAMRERYECTYWEELGLHEVPEVVSDDVDVTLRAIRAYGDARKAFLWGRKEEWRESQAKFEHEARIVYFKERIGDPTLSDELDDRLKALLGWIKCQDDHDQVKDYRVFNPKYE